MKLNGTRSLQCLLPVLFSSLSEPRWEQSSEKEVWEPRLLFQYSSLSFIMLFQSPGKNWLKKMLLVHLQECGQHHIFYYQSEFF